MSSFTKITDLELKVGVVVKPFVELTMFGLEIGFELHYQTVQYRDCSMESIGRIFIGKIDGAPEPPYDPRSVSEFLRNSESKVTNIGFAFGSIGEDNEALVYAIQIQADFDGERKDCVLWLENMNSDPQRYTCIFVKAEIFLDKVEMYNHVLILLERYQEYYAFSTSKF